MPENSIIVEYIAENIIADNQLDPDNIVCAADADFSSCDECVKIIVDEHVEGYHEGLLEMSDPHDLARRASRRAYAKIRERRNA